MADDRLFDLARDLLDQLTPFLPSPVDRTYVAPGGTAVWPAEEHCSQFTAAVGRLGATSTFPNPPPGSVPRHVVPVAKVCLEVVRCVHSPGEDGSGPAITDLEDDAAQILQDGWALWDAVFDLHHSGALLGGSCMLRQLQDVEMLGPQGGMAGARLCLLVEVPPPAGS